MIRVFVDTNILIDLLADRQLFSKFATELFGFAEKKEVHLYTSSHSMETAYYLLKKFSDEKGLRKTLLTLMDLIDIVAIDRHILQKGLSSKHKDFEDAIRIFAAHSIASMDYIVTRDIKDFRDAGITVLAPHEIVERIKASSH